MAKSCTSVFLAGTFLFVRSDTFATKRTDKWSRIKLERKFFETDNQACTDRVA